MTADLDEVIDAFRRWDEPRDGVGDNPFRLACTVDSAASHADIARALDSPVPAELADLWGRSRSMRLFVDVDYGQWGLVVLSPAESAARTNREREQRPDDIRDGDLVVGEFLGDTELVVLDRDGGVSIALPLDGRTDWDRAADSLTEFLDRYRQSVGAKYWEGH